jgi:hypothetical protein
VRVESSNFRRNLKCRLQVGRSRDRVNNVSGFGRRARGDRSQTGWEARARCPSISRMLQKVVHALAHLRKFLGLEIRALD